VLTYSVLALVLSLGLDVTDDTVRVALPEIQIEAARATQTETTAPFSVSLIARSPEMLATDPALSLERILDRVPGLWINDRGHFALGERISVRGMGWQAPFGARGVQVLLDGVPLTMPDGQSVTEMIDPTQIARAEVIRGPASLFWGNAAGGVLFLSTDPVGTAPLVRLRLTQGAFGQRHVALASHLARSGGDRVHVFLSNHSQDGYRSFSAGRMTRVGISGLAVPRQNLSLRVHAAALDQDTEAPGALTLEEMERDPRSAHPGHILANAGKRSTQVQVGSSLEWRAPRGVLTTTLYGVQRSLENPLTFAFVTFDRLAGGVRTSYQQEFAIATVAVGLDAGIQRDDRQNFNNDQGKAGTQLRLDQLETVASTGVFVSAAFDLGGGARITSGLRGDRMAFRLEDRFQAGGEDRSGRRLFSAVSPSLGLSYRTGPMLLFANVSTAYETPTTTELVNRPDGLGGFNPDLGAQRTVGAEAGIRGLAAGSAIVFDAALFMMQVRDRIISYQTTGGDGRTFFRNTDPTAHFGTELAFTARLGPELMLTSAYTFASYRYTAAPFDGNLLPGIPPHRLHNSLEWRTNDGWFTRVINSYVATYFADDANQVRADNYLLFHVHAGHTSLRTGRLVIQPFLAIDNLFDVDYIASVIGNAAAGRYFEPGPGRSLKLGVTVAI
jgi:iron complex outermembrane recepter protein